MTKYQLFVAAFIGLKYLLDVSRLAQQTGTTPGVLLAALVLLSVVWSGFAYCLIAGGFFK
jgi:hypothetical protein